MVYTWCVSHVYRLSGLLPRGLQGIEANCLRQKDRQTYRVVLRAAFCTQKTTKIEQ